MSYRTLIEINHDFASVTDREFLAFLDLYLRRYGTIRTQIACNSLRVMRFFVL